MIKKVNFNKLNIFFITLIFFCCIFFVCFFVDISAYAESENSINFESSPSTRVVEINTSNYYLYDLDSAMFNALCTLEHEIRGDGDTKENAFNADFFSVGYLDATPTSSDGQVIKNDLSQGTFYLVTGQNAKYNCLRNFGALQNLSGLDSLDLSNISELILTGNSITSISDTDLSSLTALQRLSVDSNRLSSISLSLETQSRLTYLNLSNNNLERVDISGVSNQASVDLSNNSLTDISSLSGNLGSLDISFNNITDISEIDTIRTTSGCSPIILVQGLEEVSLAGDKIIVDSSRYDLHANLEYSSESLFAGEEITIVSDSSLTEIYMPAGYVTLSFEYDVGTPSSVSSALVDRSYALKLDLPSYTVMSNGNIITDFNSTESMYFTFSPNINTNIVNYEDVLSNAVVFAGIGTEISQKSQISIEENGEYTLRAYVVFDNIQSDEVVINVTKNDYSGITWGLIIIFGIMVVIVSLWVIIRWFKNGAVVAPLSDREIARINRRKEIRESGEYYPYSYEQEGENQSDEEDVVNLSSDSEEEDDEEK